jgi:hypothetical protein
MEKGRYGAFFDATANRQVGALRDWEFSVDAIPYRSGGGGPIQTTVKGWRGSARSYLLKEKPEEGKVYEFRLARRSHSYFKGLARLTKKDLKVGVVGGKIHWQGEGVPKSIKAEED